jgi:hypothetical protein
MQAYMTIGGVLASGLIGLGCSQPLGTTGLDGQEAALAAAGSVDMREQDGTTGDPTLATLDGGNVPSPDAFDPDPFIAREEIDIASTLDESNLAPGASTLDPGWESATGDPMDQPAVNVQDE